jgi:hypothetical protein
MKIKINKNKLNLNKQIIHNIEMIQGGAFLPR